MATARLVLIVEDDPELQESMRRRLLRKQQFQVVTAFDYRTALRRLAESGPPDVACIDLGLPNESGYELCEHIRKTPGTADVPILVTSNRYFPEDMAHAEAAGANALLKKPFGPDTFARTVEELLVGPMSRREVRRLRSC